MNRNQIMVIVPTAALLFAACGSGKGVAGKTPAPNPTQGRATTTSTAAAPPAAAVPTLSAGLTDTLKKYALTPADLPSGYALGLQQQLPNETASAGFADPAAVVKEIQQSGRQGGIAQQVISTTGAGEMAVTVEAFKDAAGAQDWVAHPPAYPPSMNATPATLPQQLGEQSTAVHWTQDGNGGYLVSFRRGRFVFGLSLGAPSGKESLDALLPLAKSLDANALKQSN